MRLNRKLEQWQQAGLLSKEQLGAIREYERQHGVGWQAGLGFLGVLAIVIGLLAIIASNWQLIPPWGKLGTHLLLNTLLAFGALHKWQRPLIAQLCLLAWYGLTLTFIGLMSQVFHLSGATASALLLWTLLTSVGVIYFATSALVLLPWALGTLVTLFAAYGEYLQPLVNNDLLPALLSGALLPTALAFLTSLLKSARWQALNKQLLWLAGLLPIVTAGFVCQLWYSLSLRDFSSMQYSVFITGVVAAIAILLTCNQRLAIPEWLENTLNFQLLLLVCGSLIVLPFLFSQVRSDWLAAFSFIGLWLLLGWLGHRTHSQRLVSLAILVIALRLFLVYIEVFGSLLQTGFGLVGSGILLLGLLKLARSLSRKVNSTETNKGDHA